MRNDVTSIFTSSRHDAVRLVICQREMCVILFLAMMTQLTWTEACLTFSLIVICYVVHRFGVLLHRPSRTFIQLQWHNAETQQTHAITAARVHAISWDECSTFSHGEKFVREGRGGKSGSRRRADVNIKLVGGKEIYLKTGGIWKKKVNVDYVTWNFHFLGANRKSSFASSSFALIALRQMPSSLLLCDSSGAASTIASVKFSFCASNL